MTTNIPTTQFNNFVAYNRELLQRSNQHLQWFKSIIHQQNELIRVQVVIMKLHQDLLTMQDVIVEAYQKKKSDSVIKMLLDQLQFQRDEIQGLRINYLHMKNLMQINQNAIANSQQELESDIQQLLSN